MFKRILNSKYPIRIAVAMIITTLAVFGYIFYNAYSWSMVQPVSDMRPVASDVTGQTCEYVSVKIKDYEQGTIDLFQYAEDNPEHVEDKRDNMPCAGRSPQPNQ